MLPPAERSQKPFGTRRPAAEPDRSTRTHPATSIAQTRPAGSLAWALRISAVVGLLALVATHQLARLSQAGPASVQLALAGQGLTADPETTGSLAPAGAARVTRLDPCLLPALDRHQP